MHDGRLSADFAKLALYQGKGKGRVVLDGAQPRLGVNAGFSLKGLQAQPFLSALGFERLEGTGNADLQLAGREGSERQIVSSLVGEGSVTVLNGSVQGVNLAAMSHNLTTAFTDISGADKTDFTELSGSFTIASGIVRNPDFFLKS